LIDVLQMTGPRFSLSLYVTRHSSGEALADLYVALKKLSYNDYQLNIVDVDEKPKLAQCAKIVATPCLIYHAADGDKVIQPLSDIGLIRKTLGIDW
jgi:hypothetical protein